MGQLPPGAVRLVEREADFAGLRSATARRSPLHHPDDSLVDDARRSSRAAPALPMIHHGPPRTISLRHDEPPRAVQESIAARLRCDARDRRRTNSSNSGAARRRGEAERLPQRDGWCGALEDRLGGRSRRISGSLHRRRFGPESLVDGVISRCRSRFSSAIEEVTAPRDRRLNLPRALSA